MARAFCTSMGGVVFAATRLRLSSPNLVLWRLVGCVFTALFGVRLEKQKKNDGLVRGGLVRTEPSLSVCTCLISILAMPHVTKPDMGGTRSVRPCHKFHRLPGASLVWYEVVSCDRYTHTGPNVAAHTWSYIRSVIFPRGEQRPHRSPIQKYPPRKTPPPRGNMFRRRVLNMLIVSNSEGRSK